VETAASAPTASGSAAVADAVAKVRDLRLRDEGTVLTVSWTGLGATVVVALSRDGAPAVVLGSVPPGTSEYVIPRVEPGVAYCVVVGPVDEAAAMTLAASVCTGAR
jgi:hypothetical protein